MKLAAGIVLSVVAFTHASGDSPIIYRCNKNGATVYSDQPCDADARPHKLDDSRITLYEAPPAAEPATSSKAKRRPSQAGHHTATSHEKHQLKCDQLGRSLRDVRTKMRVGYGVEEGERLKERRRRLTAQRRAEKCR